MVYSLIKKYNSYFLLIKQQRAKTLLNIHYKMCHTLLGIMMSVHLSSIYTKIVNLIRKLVLYAASFIIIVSTKDWFYEVTYPYFSYFEVSNGFIKNIQAIFGLNEIIIFIVILIAVYCSLFMLIMKNGIYGFNSDKYGKHGLSVIILFIVGAMILTIPYYFYLIINSRYIEMAYIIIICTLVFAIFKVIKTLPEKLFNYTNISFINKSKPLLCDKTLDISISSIIHCKHKICKECMIHAYLYRNKSNLFFINFFMAIFALIVGFLLSFNVITIVFVEAMLFTCLFILSILPAIPNRTVDIYLNNSLDPYKNVYVIDDSSKEYLRILTKDNLFIDLKKELIIMIEK